MNSSFDTVSLTHVLVKRPDSATLEQYGLVRRWRRGVEGGEYWITNVPKKSKMPRITISNAKDGRWYLRVEVSISAWLFGSNVTLPSENDLHYFLSRLTKFVLDETGIPFDARTANVARIDFTRDLQIGQTSVIPMIGVCRDLYLPKYKRISYDDNCVSFRNKGNKKTKSISIYSKQIEAEQNDNSSSEIEKAAGVLRIEGSFQSSKIIESLRKKYDLPNRTAESFLRHSVATAVLDDICKKVIPHVESLGDIVPPLEKLLYAYGPTIAARLAGFLILCETFGQNFYKIERLGFKHRWYFNNLKQCREAGVNRL